MHRNFITAAKQLMGRAFVEINTGTAQCSCAYVRAHVLAAPFN